MPNKHLTATYLAHAKRHEAKATCPRNDVVVMEIKRQHCSCISV